MKFYQDVNGDSGVYSYDYGHEYIIVEFKNGSRYEYTYQSAGEANIEEMKRLADRGDGLNAYINKHVKMLYSEKTR